MESGLRIKSAEEESMSGLMVVDMKETGRKTTCMEEEFTLGKVVDAMKESI